MWLNSKRVHCYYFTKRPLLHGYGILQHVQFLVRDVTYTSRAYATMSVSVCPSRKCIGSRCMPGTQRLRQPAKLKPSYDPQQTWPPPTEGSSRAMLATARPSCLFFYLGPPWLDGRESPCGRPTERDHNKHTELLVYQPGLPPLSHSEARMPSGRGLCTQHSLCQLMGRRVARI